VVTVEYATQDLSARAGKDYEAVKGTLHFEPGETVKKVAVRTMDQPGAGLGREREFKLVLTAAEGGRLDDAEGVGRIVPTKSSAEDSSSEGGQVLLRESGGPTVNIGNAYADEHNGYITFTVTLSSIRDEYVWVEWETFDGDASAGEDYVWASGTVTFAPSVTEQTITVELIDDEAKEDTEVFSVVLTSVSSSASVTTGVSSGTGTIYDDDEEPQIFVYGDDADEGESVEFQVVLSHAYGLDVEVDYITQDGTAHASSDYTAKAGRLTISAGYTTASVSVAASLDGIDDSADDEHFSLILSNPSNATFGNSETLGVIHDLEGVPEVCFYSDEESASEGESITFTVSLSHGSEKTVTVDYQTGDGTAKADGDYTSADSSVVFAPSQTSKIIPIQTNEDDIDEWDEDFYVTLTGATNASVSQGTSATGTIYDIDDEPEVYFASSSESAREGDGEIVFTVSLSHASEKEITVYYETGEASAAAHQASADVDYASTSGSLVFAPYDPENPVTEQPITITVNDDQEDEYDEDFLLILTGAENASVSETSVAVGTIVDDDVPTVWIELAPLSCAVEGVQIGHFQIHRNSTVGELTVEHRPLPLPRRRRERFSTLPLLRVTRSVRQRSLTRQPASCNSSLSNRRSNNTPVFLPPRPCAGRSIRSASGPP